MPSVLQPCEEWGAADKEEWTIWINQWRERWSMEREAAWQQAVGEMRALRLNEEKIRLRELEAEEWAKNQNDPWMEVLMLADPEPLWEAKTHQKERNIWMRMSSDMAHDAKAEVQAHKEEITAKVAAERRRFDID